MPYYIPDGERPDVTSYNTYGDVKYVWVIMFVNNIFNPYTDWPLSQKQLTKNGGHLWISHAAARSTHTKIHVEMRSTTVDTSTQGPDTESVSARVVTKFEFEVDKRRATRNHTTTRSISP